MSQRTNKKRRIGRKRVMGEEEKTKKKAPSKSSNKLIN